VARIWSLVAERKIQEARREGAFAGLSGSGRPLSLDDDSATAPEWRTPFHILKNAGMLPDWLALDREIRIRIERLAEDVRIDAEWTRGDGEAWAGVAARFRRRVAEINRQIGDLNLRVPVLKLQRLRLDADRELKRALSTLAEES
jgi:hypothetical protein